ncbi:14575_t:CDS:2 [Entrophospora sp. SA101]|nr:14575_t:CDS:2 [Entrophospora sp. SA101]CAJ0904780.1 11839_t:CDS:2 [Entrophospora sp. SA101]
MLQQFNENYIVSTEASQSPPLPPLLATGNTGNSSEPSLQQHQQPLLSHPFPQSPAPQPPIFSSSPLLACYDFRDIIAPSQLPQGEHLDITEFKQYDREKYESSKTGVNNCNRRRRKQTQIRVEDCDTASSLDGYDDDDISNNININNRSTHAEIRRQMHIQSEQKRRAEIKDGFEDLRRLLPIFNHSRKMSKALLLQKTVSHIKNTKTKECYLLDEINRLNHYINYLATELEREKRMNNIYQQKETLDKLYQIGL